MDKGEEEEEAGGEERGTDTGGNDLNQIPRAFFLAARVVRVIGGRREEVSVRIFWRANRVSVTPAEAH